MTWCAWWAREMDDTLKSVSSLPGVAILPLIITVFQPLSASRSPRVFHAPLSMCNAPNIAKNFGSP